MIHDSDSVSLPSAFGNDSLLPPVPDWTEDRRKYVALVAADRESDEEEYRKIGRMLWSDYWRYRTGSVSLAVLHFLGLLGPIILGASIVAATQITGMSATVIAVLACASTVFSILGGFGNLKSKWEANSHAVYSLRILRRRFARGLVLAQDATEQACLITETHAKEWEPAR